MSEQLPVSRAYIDEAMSHVQFKTLAHDGTWYGEIPGFQGVWANAKSLDACREELREVLEDWLALKRERGVSIPGLAAAP
jgi:predicted RNase H-like HicB family nuclease